MLSLLCTQLSAGITTAQLRRVSPAYEQACSSGMSVLDEQDS